MWKIALFIALISIPVAAKAMPCMGIGLICAPITGFVAISSQPTNMEWSDGTNIDWSDGTNMEWSGN